MPTICRHAFLAVFPAHSICMCLRLPDTLEWHRSSDPVCEPWHPACLWSPPPARLSNVLVIWITEVLFSSIISVCFFFSIALYILCSFCMDFFVSFTFVLFAFTLLVSGQVFIIRLKPLEIHLRHYYWEIAFRDCAFWMRHRSHVTCGFLLVLCVGVCVCGVTGPSGFSSFFNPGIQGLDSGCQIKHMRLLGSHFVNLKVLLVFGVGFRNSITGWTILFFHHLGGDSSWSIVSVSLVFRVRGSISIFPH